MIPEASSCTPCTLFKNNFFRRLLNIRCGEWEFVASLSRSIRGSLRPLVCPQVSLSVRSQCFINQFTKVLSPFSSALSVLTLLPFPFSISILIVFPFSSRPPPPLPSFPPFLLPSFPLSLFPSFPSSLLPSCLLLRELLKRRARRWCKYNLEFSTYSSEELMGREYRDINYNQCNEDVRTGQSQRMQPQPPRTR